MTDVVVDLNVRVGRLTRAGFEDVRGEIPESGTSVRVVEEETGISGPGIVTSVDYTRRIVYLAVAWRELTA